MIPSVLRHARGMRLLEVECSVLVDRLSAQAVLLGASRHDQVMVCFLFQYWVVKYAFPVAKEVTTERVDGSRRVRI